MPSLPAPEPRIRFEACPLCKSGNIKTLLKADCSRHPLYCDVVPPIMTWLRCENCAHVFTDGYFSSNALAAIFSCTNENQKPGWAFEQQRPISARMIERVLRYTSTGMWLDVAAVESERTGG